MYIVSIQQLDMTGGGGCDTDLVAATEEVDSVYTMGISSNCQHTSQFLVGGHTLIASH